MSAEQTLFTFSQEYLRLSGQTHPEGPKRGASLQGGGEELALWGQEGGGPWSVASGATEAQGLGDRQ